MYHVLLSFRPVGIVTLMSMLAVIALTGCTRRVISVDEVDKMIVHQVPLGSDKPRVKDFVDNLKVEHLKIIRSEFREVNKRLRPVGFWDPEKLADLWDRVEELIALRIVDAESGFQNRNDIVVEFAIDKDGRMIGYTVKMVGTE